PAKAAFVATPDFSKVAAPRKALRAFVARAERAGSRLLFVAAVEDDLRAVEARRREGALLADFDAGFFAPGKKQTLVVTASDVLGSRAHHPQPMAKAW